MGALYLGCGPLGSSVVARSVCWQIDRLLVAFRSLLSKLTDRGRCVLRWRIVNSNPTAGSDS